MVFAANTVGSVSSANTFVLRGVSTPADGVPNWPIAMGDEIQTMTSPATVTLSDGSRVVLGPNTKARIEGKATEPSFHLLSGAMEVRTSSSPSVHYVVENAPATVPAGTTKTFSTRVAAGRTLLPTPPGIAPPVVSNR